MAIRAPDGANNESTSQLSYKHWRVHQITNGQDIILILFCQLYVHVFVIGTTGGSVNVAQTISKSMTISAMSICQRMPIGVAEAISISVPKTMTIGVPKTMAVVTVEGVRVSLGLSHSGGVGLGLGLPLVGQVVKSQNL